MPSALVMTAAPARSSSWLVCCLVLLTAQLARGRPGRWHPEDPVHPADTDSSLPWVEQLSWKPRAYYYHNFLSAEEADHVISLAKPFLRRSTVVGTGEGGAITSYRTSYGTFLKRLRDPAVAKLQQRVAEWTHLNVSHQEDLQVLRYSAGQAYGAHKDGLGRAATVLLYLSDVEEGGETAFTEGSEWLDPALPRRLGPFSPCAQGHVAAPSRKGDALLFFSQGPDGGQDRHALHTGCPVVKGVKWTATVWMHAQPYRPEELEEAVEEEAEGAGLLPQDCTDTHSSCEAWAAAGECERNPGYMVGDHTGLGRCRKACGSCQPCQAGDVACQDRNRVALGYLPLAELQED